LSQDEFDEFDGEFEISMPIYLADRRKIL
jgi:hypothetical protein